MQRAEGILVRQQAMSHIDTALYSIHVEAADPPQSSIE